MTEFLGQFFRLGLRIMLLQAVRPVFVPGPFSYP